MAHIQETGGSTPPITSMEVKTFDEEAILEDLRQDGKMEAIRLIEAYKQAMDNQQKITAQALNKIRDLSKRIEKNGSKTIQ